MKKKLLSLTAIGVAAILTLAACTPGGAAPAQAPPPPQAPQGNQPADTPADTASDEPVHFMAFAMMTGPNAESGRQVTMAAQTAEWYINEVLGGFSSLGGRPIQITVIDSTSDAAQASLPFEQALDAGNYSVVIGNSNSSIALVQLPIAERFEIPMITGAAANAAISQQGSTFSFQPSAIAATFIPLQLEFLEYYANHLGIEFADLNLGLIYANDAWGTDNAQNTRTQLEARGLSLAVDMSYEVATFTDATPLVTALMNAGVDVIMPSSYPSDLSLIFTAMGALNYNPLVLGGGAGMTWPSLFVDIGEQVNGITSVDSWVWDQTGAREHAGWQMMNDWYEEQFGEFIPGQGGPTLISIMTAFAAIERIGSDDPIAIRDELRRVTQDDCDWFGIINGFSDFDPETGLNTASLPVILQWQNNRPTAVFPPDLAASPLLNPQTLEPFN
ncbi:MAG: ABC transporter substrate-binding protein [Defluviitaleaceae bacterium]|nr:ABC transporter substrate-binding protein [Defluviitaleaceae bacterium]